MHESNPPASGELKSSQKPFFALPVRVYYEDTDAGGVVYYANYLKFCERARTEWLRAIGFGQQAIAAEQAIVFVVRAVQADYRRAAVLDDQLEVITTVHRLGRASLVFGQKIARDGEVVFEATVTIACMDLGSRRAAPIPPAVYAQLATLV